MGTQIGIKKLIVTTMTVITRTSPYYDTPYGSDDLYGGSELAPYGYDTLVYDGTSTEY